MMQVLKIIFISILLILIIFIVTIFLTKDYIFNIIKINVIDQIENATNKNIDVGNFTVTPLKGMSLKNIRITDRNAVASEGIFINSVSAKINLLTLIREREITASLNFEGIKNGNIDASGMVLLTSYPIKNIFSPFKDFSLNNIKLYHLNISSPYATLKDMSGSIVIKEPEIKIKISGHDIDADFNLIETKDNLTKIDKSFIKFFNSRLDFTGEIQNVKNPILFMSGSLDLDLEDSLHLNNNTSAVSNYLKPKGNLYNEFYLKGPLKGPINLWEAGSKGSSPLVSIRGYNINNFSYNLKLENGIVSIPILITHPYNGILNASLGVDISKKDMPYYTNLVLKEIDINRLSRDSELRNINIYGTLFSELNITGYGKDTDSITGKGRVFITDANLGPMPLLSPLLGNTYGVLRNMIPSLKTVEITGGSCTFDIENRKILTNDLMLWGDIMNIKARGYLDFDTNLNFEVENEFKEVPEQKEEWQKTIMDTITTVGKFISKAYLTGTLSKPKWKFDYEINIQDVMKGKIKDIFEDILN